MEMYNMVNLRMIDSQLQTTSVLKVQAVFRTIYLSLPEAQWRLG